MQCFRQRMHHITKHRYASRNMANTLHMVHYTTDSPDISPVELEMKCDCETKQCPHGDAIQYNGHLSSDISLRNIFQWHDASADPEIIRKKIAGVVFKDTEN